VGLNVDEKPPISDEFVALMRQVSAESRHTIRSALTVLSLMEGRPAMPDPLEAREAVARLLSMIGGHDG
jgi:hypothetical protein